MPVNLKIAALIKDLDGYQVARWRVAVVELGKLGQEAAEPLAEIVRHSKIQRLQARSLLALARTGVPLAREVLLECLKVDDVSFPATAAYELVRYIEESEVFEALAATLKGDDYFLISIAVSSLGESCGAAVLPLLINVARDCPSSDARCAALYALMNVPPMRVFLPVLQGLEDDPLVSMRVQIAARQLRRNWRMQLGEEE